MPISSRSEKLELRSTSDKYQPLNDLRSYSRIRKMFIASVGIQIVLLAGFAVPQAYTLSTGKVITLRTVPVDPTDLFRGEYARLNYKDIASSNINAQLGSGQTVFVVLEKPDNNPDWKIVSLKEKQPEINEKQVCLRGKISRIDGSRSSPTYQIEYGIERLYMPAGKSLDLERNAQELEVDIAVGPDGNAVLKEVKLKGQAVYDGMNMFNPFEG